MNRTKGHNNLTKLNEKTSCICGKAFQENSSYGFAYVESKRSFASFFFQKLNTLDIKHHIREDHTNST